MKNWQKLMEVDERPRRSKKPDKTKFCRKNKNKNKYGPHFYAENSNECSLCGHLRNKTIIIIPREIEDER